MLDGFIGKQIQRSNRNLFLANFGLLLVPLTIGFINPRYWYNFALGPFPIERQTLLSIQDPDKSDKNFLNIEGDKSFKTGFQEITKRVSKRTGSVTSETVSGEYIALVIDKKILIVKAKTENASNTKFTGELVNLPENVQSNLISKAEAENPREIMERVPWVIMGFSDELQQLWNTDRSRMFEFIDERRQQVMSS